MMVLFVCTGNTCRSPMAAVLAQKLWTDAGLPVTTVSAGLAAFEASCASRNAVAVMREETEGSVDLSRHRAQGITRALTEGASLVLTMTSAHKHALVHLYPSCTGKIFTLGEYAGDDQDIPDPYGGDMDAYRACADAILEKLRVITKTIRAKLAQTIKEGFMGKLHVTNHSLVQSKIAMLRSVDTGNKEFRELVGEIATLIGYEATRDVPLVETEIETPVCRTRGKVCEQKFGIVPILRAGLGMVEGISRLLPTAKIGHIGLYRDPESLQPVEYYCKLPPDCEEREILLLDPMLATGNTATAAIGYLKEHGVRHIKLLCLIAAPEGVAKLHECHPDVEIYTAAYDERLNDHGYIVPGLGDAGDRLFGTK